MICLLSYLEGTLKATPKNLKYLIFLGIQFEAKTVETYTYLFFNLEVPISLLDHISCCGKRKCKQPIYFFTQEFQFNKRRLPGSISFQKTLKKRKQINKLFDFWSLTDVTKQ